LVAVIFISSALWRYYRFAEIFEREESSKLSYTASRGLTVLENWSEATSACQYPPSRLSVFPHKDC